MSLATEFKEFALKGNVVDLAVGVIIGTAFGKIVTSIVNDVIMPPIGLILGGINFKDFKVILKQATVDAAGQPVEAVAINYGNFIQTAVDFLIVAFFIFLMIKLMNLFRKKQAEEKAAPSAPTTEEKLLTEIRDILKSQKP